jgi:hypothetical protein
VTSKIATKEMGLALGSLARTLKSGVKPEPCSVQSVVNSAEHSAPPSSPNERFKVTAFKAEILHEQEAAGSAKVLLGF